MFLPSTELVVTQIELQVPTVKRNYVRKALVMSLHMSLNL